MHTSLSDLEVALKSLREENRLKTLLIEDYDRKYFTLCEYVSEICEETEHSRECLFTLRDKVTRLLKQVRDFKRRNVKIIMDLKKRVNSLVKKLKDVKEEKTEYSTSRSIDFRPVFDHSYDKKRAESFVEFKPRIFDEYRIDSIPLVKRLRKENLLLKKENALYRMKYESDISEIYDRLVFMEERMKLISLKKKKHVVEPEL